MHSMAYNGYCQVLYKIFNKWTYYIDLPRLYSKDMPKARLIIIWSKKKNLIRESNILGHIIWFGTIDVPLPIRVSSYHGSHKDNLIESQYPFRQTSLDFFIGWVISMAC